MGYSEDNSYEKILSRVLGSEALAGMDRREGSVIYDAVAPMCFELAQAYAKMDIMEAQTFLLSATGVNLDKRVYDYGLLRKAAVPALRVGEFKKYATNADGSFRKDEDGGKILVEMEIPEGSRFATPESAETVFEYVGKMEEKDAEGVPRMLPVLRCESAGARGNDHFGKILPITPILGLAEARIVGTYSYGEDAETDEELRSRAVTLLNHKSFGGNVWDYIERVGALDGVGGVKVFPAWQYNGSVMVSVTTTEYDPMDRTSLLRIKEAVDPETRAVVDPVSQEVTLKGSSGGGYGIAPIGHYVTVVTPQKKYVKIRLKITPKQGYEANTVKENIENKLREHLAELRRSFAQNVTIVVSLARIVAVLLDKESGAQGLEDITLEQSSIEGATAGNLALRDEGRLADAERLEGCQWLPYLGEEGVEIVE